MIIKLFKLSKALLLNKQPKSQTLPINESYPKLGLMSQNILHFGPLFMFSFVIFLTLAAFSTGCSGSLDGKAAKKAEPVDERDVLGAMPEQSVSQKRAERELKFKDEIRDSATTPIIDPSASERAPAEYGFGVRTPEQIEKERPRANKIAVLAPLVGDVAVFGIDTVDGADLAADEVNAHGGIKGQQFDLLVYDTKGTIAGARTGVIKLARENVSAILGAPTGEVSFSDSKSINDNQQILLSAGSRRRLGDTGPYYFRNTLDDNHGIKRLMEYVVVEKKMKKFALFTSLINDYSIKLSAAFKKEIDVNKAQLTDELYIISPEMTNVDKEETSIPAQLQKLKKNLPDAIIYTGDGMEGAQVIREMRKMGLKIPMVGAEDLMIPEFTVLGAAGAGTMVYGGFNDDSDNPRIKTFVASFKKKYNRTPSRVAALSYDAYYMLAKSMNASKSMRPSHLRDALAELKGFEGVTGKIEMGKNREAIKEPFILEMQSKGGQYRFVSVKEPL